MIWSVLASLGMPLVVKIILSLFGPKSADNQVISTPVRLLPGLAIVLAYVDRWPLVLARSKMGILVEVHLRVAIVLTRPWFWHFRVVRIL